MNRGETIEPVASVLFDDKALSLIALSMPLRKTTKIHIRWTLDFIVENFA